MPRTIYIIRTGADAAAPAPDPAPDTARLLLDTALVVLRDSPAALTRLTPTPARAHILLSGTPNPPNPPDPTDPADPNTDFIPTWSPAAWAALVEHLTAFRARGVPLAIRPHARHVVSDVPSCARLLRHLAEPSAPASAALAPCALLFDPAAIVPDDEPRPAVRVDLLTRAYEAVPDLAALGPLLAVVVAPCPGVPADLPAALAAALPTDIGLAHPSESTP